jgi:hypothetical protein
MVNHQWRQKSARATRQMPDKHTQLQVATVQQASLFNSKHSMAGAQQPINTRAWYHRLLTKRRPALAT